MSARSRLLLSAVLVVAVGAAGWVADRLVGARALPGAPSARGVSGAWFCPHGGGPSWRSWVTVANPSEAPAHVRVTTFQEKTSVADDSFDLPSREERFVEVPSTARGSGTMVEYFGASVGAGWVSAGEGGVAAEACQADAGRKWIVADGDTRRGHDSYLVVMNPFAQDAAFDVTLLTAERAPIRAGALRGYVLRARRSVAFRLSTIVLDQASVGAVVHATLGAVAVGEVGVDEGAGIRAVAAVPGPALRWVLPGAGDVGESALALEDVSVARAPVTARTQTPTAQTLIEPLTDESLRALSSRAFTVETGTGPPPPPAPKPPPKPVKGKKKKAKPSPRPSPSPTVAPPPIPSSLVAEATSRTPIVAARRSASPAGDLAATSGAPAARASWLVPPAVPPDGGAQYVVLANPGRAAARVGLRLVGGADADLGTFDVPPGRTVLVALRETVGETPAWALVLAERGTVVAASAATSAGGEGFAEAMGLPL